MSRLLRSKQTCFHSPMNPKRREDQNADDKDRRQDGEVSIPVLQSLDNPDTH
ncbi:unnamed protein product [Brassica oleracea var. botrytis]